ncbi:DUF6397 family protein [Streptomyces sp. NPDC018610]|uniref:DUF6397 family protein n=1 Tax=Streptomyces sp. NPDC018610 TaxID=3365049 RepID=UPI0037A2113C
MSGDTITHETTPTAGPTARHRETPLTQARAARELGLKPGEFDLAVHLGHIRTLPDEGGGGRRVARAEIQRLLAQEDFPRTLRKRVAVVGTKDGAETMRVTAARFTRLARLGLLVPVTFYLNRYRAVVWLYTADDLREFAADTKNAALLNKPLPEGLRDQLDAGLDLRPRNWRGRHLGFLLRQAGDPWERAAAVASLLDPLQVSEIVADPYERARLHRYRPRPEAHGAPGSPAAHLTERITTAQDADEIAWLRADLAQEMGEARAHRPAPRPAPRHSDRRPVRVPHPDPDPAGRHRLNGRTDAARPSCRRDQPVPAERTGRSARAHGLLGRLFRRGAPHA